MAEDELIKLSFQADTTQVKAAEAATEKLGTAVGATGERLRDASGRFLKMGSDAAVAAKGLDATTAAVTRNTTALAQAGSATAGAGKGMAGFGQTVQATGRIVQDFTAGFQSNGLKGAINAIANNTEQLGTSLAKTAGLSNAWAAAIGGGFQLVAVGVQLGLPYLEQLAEKLGLVEKATAPAMTAIERLRDTIKHLNDNPLKTLTDKVSIAGAEADLKRLTAAAERYNQVRGLKSPDQAKGESQFTQALANAPQGAAAVQEQLRLSIAREQEAKDPGMREARDKQAAAEAEKKAIEGRLAGGSYAEREADRARHAVVSKEVEKQKARGGDAYDAIWNPDTGSAAMKAGRLLGSAPPNEDPAAFQREKEAALKKAGLGDIAQHAASADPLVVKQEREAEEQEQRMKKVAQDIEAYEAKQFEEMKKANQQELDAWTVSFNNKKERIAKEKALSDKAFEDSKKANEKRLKEQEDFQKKMEDLVKAAQARVVQQRQTNQGAASSLMDRMGAASGLGDPVMQMMMQAREASANNPMRRQESGAKSWDEMSPKERQAATRASRADAKAAYEDKKTNPLGMRWEDLSPAEQAAQTSKAARQKADANAMANPRAKAWADMTPDERRAIETKDGETPQAAARRLQREAKRPLSFEEREQEQARRNAANDDIVKGQLTKQLMRNGVTRDPNFAAGLANKMVNEKRAELDGKTGDQPVEENTKATQTLTAAIEDLNRNGLRRRMGP